MAKKKTTNHNNESEMTLRELLQIKLNALYDVENQLIKALPKMAKNAADPDLKEGFEKHLEQTRGHAERLEQAFAEEFDGRPHKLQVEAIRGMIADTEWGFKNISGPAAIDANLIAAARYVENYEIAGYTMAIEWANLLGMDEVADLLNQTLEEEETTDEELDELARSKVNKAAVGDTEGIVEDEKGNTTDEGKDKTEDDEESDDDATDEDDTEEDGDEDE